MDFYLSNERLPKYLFSSFRKFTENEKHIDRTINEDVLLIMLDGVLCFSEDGIPFEITAGEYYFQRKGRLQQGVVPSRTPYYYYIHFDGDWCTKGDLATRGVFSHRVPKLLDELYRLEQQNASLLSKTAVFFEILLNLKGTTVKDAKQRLADQIADYINQNITTGITTKKLEEKFNFSRNYIIRIFKEEYGLPPHAYLRRLRLERAEQFINYSDLSLQQIACECGFESYMNLYKAYTSHYGHPPSTARKSI